MFTNDELMTESEKLMKFAHKLTQNHHDAEDLLHSTIERALMKKHLYKQDTNLFGWTSKIMYNLFITKVRRRNKFETKFDPENYINTQQVAANQDIKAEYREVSEAIDTLPKKHKQILKMIFVSGNKYEDVSKKLNIPIGTVRSRVSRARNNLKETLQMDAPGVQAA